MHPSTYQLAASLRALPDMPERVRLLHNSYEGATCVIVTCGPSLSHIEVDPLRDALQGTLTIAVKQAIDAVGDQTDFLCFNSFNVTRFRAPPAETIRCLIEEASGQYPQFNRSDLRFRLHSDSGVLDRSLATTMDFDQHHLIDDGPRPWGPGIMYELVLHLAVHLGVREIITLGWDIGNDRGRNTHFYDDEVAGPSFDRERGEGVTAASIRARMPDSVRRSARWTRAAISHSRGRLYNRALPVPGEADRVAASTGAVNAWLSDNGVHLIAVTPSEHLAPSIERLDADQLFDHLASR